MLAEGDDGPFIPSMALEALVRRCLAGDRPANGARPAIRELELVDYDRLFARRAIVTGIRQMPEPDAPLYARLLGAAWDDLPETVRHMHGCGKEWTAEGRATVERGRNALARLAAWSIGFPPAGQNVPVRVTFTRSRVGEHWQRDFGGNRFASFQAGGTEHAAHLLSERFGPFKIDIALVVDGDCLRLVPRRWSLLGLPMPRWLTPNGDSLETVGDGRFRFHVEIRLPLAGLLVRYQGWLEPVSEEAEAAAG